MKINSLGLIWIEKKLIVTFFYNLLRKGLFQPLFVLSWIMFVQFLNITMQELTHSILILPRQTQLEFTLSLFLRLHCHQTYQLKTCWYSEKCNGRLLYNLDGDKSFCALIKIIFQRHIAKDTSDILSRLSCQSLCSLVSVLALDKLNKKAGQNMEDKETKAILVWEKNKRVHLKDLFLGLLPQ